MTIEELDKILKKIDSENCGSKRGRKDYVAMVMSNDAVAICETIPKLVSALMAAKDLVTALDNVIACSDDEHPSRYAPLEAREALRQRLSEVGL